MVKVNWSKKAIEDIFEIREHYSLIAPGYAEKLTDEIFAKENLLSEFPLAGRVVPELQNESVRELLFKNYRIIYVSLDSKSITVIAVHNSLRPLSDFSVFG